LKPSQEHRLHQSLRGAFYAWLQWSVRESITFQQSSNLLAIRSPNSLQLRTFTWTTINMSAIPGAGAPVLRFRNYRPHDATVKAAAAEVAKPAAAPSVQLHQHLQSVAFAGTSAAAMPVIHTTASAQVPAAAPAAAAAASSAAGDPLASESESGGSADRMLSVTAADGDQITIAPRKANWDLKRDVQAKLEALDKQTDRAIAELVRRNIAEKAAARSAGAASGIEGGDASVESETAEELARAVMSRDAGAEEIDLG
jgi:coiled-coil domain-containing protein 12